MLARSVERPRCIAGSATFTTEPSIKLRLLPRMVTGSTHRVSLLSLWAGLRGGSVSHGRRCGPSKAISRVLSQARTYPIPHPLAAGSGDINARAHAVAIVVTAPKPLLFHTAYQACRFGLTGMRLRVMDGSKA